MWLVSSIFTNLLLQKVVLLRVDIVAKDSLPLCLTYIFYVEVCTAAALLCMTAFVTALYVAVGASGIDMYNRLSSRSTVTLSLLLVGVLAITFVLLDLVFSIYGSLVMHRAIREVQQKGMSKTSAVVSSIAKGKGFQFSSSLERAVFFGKLNLCLVVSSAKMVLTSS